MNAKANTQAISSRILRARFNPIRNLRPDTISRALEEFEAGRLGGAARIFEAILRRDDLICGLNLKRKKSIARLESEIMVSEDSAKAFEHKKILSDFYSSKHSRFRKPRLGFRQRRRILYGGKPFGIRDQH